MEELRVNIVGASVLVTHNNQMVNPINAYTKAMKEITGIHHSKKTDEHHFQMGRIEWEGGLYLEDGKVVMPGRCINASFWNGAKVNTNGMKWKAGCMLDAENYPMEYRGPEIIAEPSNEIPNTSLDKYFDTFKLEEIVTVGKAKIVRTRPIFHDWVIRDIGILFDPEVIDKETIIQACEDAGRMKGLCENRPVRGRFTIEPLS